jgi:hypothetical protein
MKLQFEWEGRLGVDKIFQVICNEDDGTVSIMGDTKDIPVSTLQRFVESVVGLGVVELENT